jgi:hypothetical protein
MKGKPETLEEFLARGGSIKKIDLKRSDSDAPEPTVWGKGMSRTVRGGRVMANEKALDALRAAPIADTPRDGSIKRPGDG